jgi:uncharacterized coiled-coil DUF342 family protein
MEIQIGFRLSNVQELEVLTRALQLCEDKSFKEELTLAKHVSSLSEQYANLMAEIDKLKKEEAELRRRVTALKEVLAKYQSVAEEVRATAVEP